MTAQLEIQNGTVYDSGDIREIWRPVYDYWNRRPRSYPTMVPKWANGTTTTERVTRKRGVKALPITPIRVRGYAPSKTTAIADCRTDRQAEIVMLKIRSPHTLPQSSLIALAQCLDNDESSVSRAALIRIIKAICKWMGMVDCGAPIDDKGVDHGRLVDDYKLRLRYSDAVTKDVAAHTKRVDVLLRRDKLIGKRGSFVKRVRVLRLKMEQAQEALENLDRKVVNYDKQLEDLNGS